MFCIGVVVGGGGAFLPECHGRPPKYVTLRSVCGCEALILGSSCVCERERHLNSLVGEQLGSVNMLSSVPQSEVPAPTVHFIHSSLRDIRVCSSGEWRRFSQSTEGCFCVCVSSQPLVWICYLPSVTLRAWLEPIKREDELHVLKEAYVRFGLELQTSTDLFSDSKIQHLL